MPIVGGRGRRLATGLCCAVLSFYLLLLCKLQVKSEAKRHHGWIKNRFVVDC